MITESGTKRMVGILAFLICASLIPSVFSAELSTESDVEWTIGIYMCGTDLESNWGAATTDIVQILGAGIPENVTILLLTGGTKVWNPNGFPSYKYITPSSEVTQLWKIDNKGMHLIEDLGEQLDMGDPKTLTYLLETMVNDYPAKRLMLNIWNHGGGPISGVAFDEYTDNSLSLLEIKSVFEKVLQKTGGKKIDLLGFDACLMSSMETAALLSPYADYMIASPEVMYGWVYIYWLEKLNEAEGNMEADVLGRHIVDGLIYRESNSDSGWTQSKVSTGALVDLSKMDKLVTAFNDMALELSTNVLTDDEIYAKVARQAERVDPMSNGKYGLLDLYDFAYSMTPYLKSSIDVMMAVGIPPGTMPKHFLGEVDGGAVIYRGTSETHKKGVGLTFYYPTIKTDIEENAVDVYRGLKVSDSYTSYLYNTIVAVDNLRGFKGDMTVEMGDTNYNYELVLSDDELIGVKAVEYIITREIFDDEGTKVVSYLLGRDQGDWDFESGIFADNYDGMTWYAINGNICSMDVSELELGISNEEGEPFDILSIPVFIDDEDSLSTMTILLAINEDNSGYKALILGFTSDNETISSRLRLPLRSTKIYTTLQEFSGDFSADLLDSDIEANILFKKSNTPIPFIDEDEDGYFYIDFAHMLVTDLDDGNDGKNVCYFMITDMRNELHLSEPLDCSQI